MKKHIIRLVAFFLCLVSMVNIMAVSANAASSVSSVNCQYNSRSGGGSQFFYVKTGSTSNSRKITLTMGTGTISGVNFDNGKLGSAAVYGAYEIKVFYKNDKGGWTLEQDYDVYNKSNATITCNKKNTVYKIQVYFWRVSTTFASYWRNNIKTQTLCKRFQARFPGASNNWEQITWSTLPTCKATPKKGCTIYTSCP